MSKWIPDVGQRFTAERVANTFPFGRGVFVVTSKDAEYVVVLMESGGTPKPMRLRIAEFNFQPVS